MHTRIHLASVFRAAGAVLFVLVLSASAHAQITPSADAYTSSTAPTTNYGAATLLYVNGATEISYIQFNLASIPSGASISKATLKLYVNGVTTAGSFNVDYVNGAWTESKITYDLAPALGTTIVSGVALTTASKNQYILIDITSAVEAWLKGSQANDGIALVANSTFNANFDSKENTATSHPPELDVVFAPGSGGGTITGVTTASGSGLQGGGTSGTLNLSLLTTCSSGQVLSWSGSAWTCTKMGGGGSGTVTSVALTAPSTDFVVTGSPVTTSGTLGLGWVLAPDYNNTPNAIVKRDSSGSFSAGTVRGSSSGEGPGVIGTNTDSGIGVAGDSTSGVGVSGNGSLVGVEGLSSSGSGVHGGSSSGDGVVGGSSGAVPSAGVYGTNNNYDGFGVYGSSTAGIGIGVMGSGYYGVYGVSTNSDGVYAGYFDGAVDVEGYLYKDGGGFKIDHPLDPANKYLYHSFVESPDMKNVYDGNVILDGNGSAWISLPDYFEVLNRDFRYQLTAIGAPGPNLYIAQEIANNRFQIAGGAPGGKVSWQVTGIRQDVYAKAHPIIPEVAKTGGERGKYREPVEHGMPKSLGIAESLLAKMHPSDNMEPPKPPQHPPVLQPPSSAPKQSLAPQHIVVSEPHK